MVDAVVVGSGPELPPSSVSLFDVDLRRSVEIAGSALPGTGRRAPARHATGTSGTYLCAAATPPGVGVHGRRGANAAERALAHLGNR